MAALNFVEVSIIYWQLSWAHTEHKLLSASEAKHFREMNWFHQQKYFPNQLIGFEFHWEKYSALSPLNFPKLNSKVQKTAQALHVPIHQNGAHLIARKESFFLPSCEWIMNSASSYDMVTNFLRSHSKCLEKRRNTIWKKKSFRWWFREHGRVLLIMLCRYTFFPHNVLLFLSFYCSLLV